MTNPAPNLVSTFELLFIPQLPTSLRVGNMTIPVPASVVSIDEIALKGYFLTIANINPNPYVFSLGFHINPANGAAPPSQNSLASALGFIDDGSGGVVLPLNPTTPAIDYHASVKVQANGTALVGILPNFINTMSNPPGLATPNIEVRGWVDITLPAVRGKTILQTVPQASAPVSVLLTAEQRITFLPMAGAPSSTVESQTAFAVPLAGGASEISIPPQPGGYINIGNLGGLG